MAFQHQPSKNSSKTRMPLFRQIVLEGGSILRTACAIARRHWRWLLLLLLIAGTAAWRILPYDIDIHSWIVQTQPAPWKTLARRLSFWGDYWTGTLILSLLLWGLGALGRKPRWRRAAFACLLAATLAGVTANVFRYSCGRPRPRAEEPDGLRGFRLESRYHSFPSGHATTSMATAAALATALPAAGFPVLLAAVGVVWSRLYLSAHYPTDVLLGSALGLVFGLVFGLAARRLTDGRNHIAEP